MTKTILYTALVAQVIGFSTLIITDASSLPHDIALCAVVGAGVVEVVLGWLARRQESALGG
jgi:hypothetical protein